MEPSLSQREFDTWREGDEKFKRQILDHITSQTQFNLDVQGRLSTVEAEQEKCSEKVSRRTTWLSAIVSAIVGGAIGLWRG